MIVVNRVLAHPWQLKNISSETSSGRCNNVAWRIGERTVRMGPANSQLTMSPSRSNSSGEFKIGIKVWVMVPAGYLAKHVRKPEGLGIEHVSDVYSVSNCVNDNFADYINYWKHNGYWLFDSPEIIRTVAHENSIELEGASLFYYEVYEMEFDGKTWCPFQAETSFLTNVISPPEKVLEGFDVVTFYCKSSPEHSPLSCNGIANEIRTNEHCLLFSFDDAYEKITSGAFNEGEPGPYRIFAVYSVDWPQ